MNNLITHFTSAEQLITFVSERTIDSLDTEQIIKIIDYYTDKIQIIEDEYENYDDGYREGIEACISALEYLR